MENENLISIAEFCRYHHVDSDFIQILEQNGLIETTMVQQSVYVQTDHLGQLEKFVRLHQELNIPAENLDIISHLLSRMENLQQEIKQLKNRLGFYE
ncbi:MAG TPA: chaperone modulator CbpM [Puia sp.]|nr:chaperone modulator CbpM [Puia sp.]